MFHYIFRKATQKISTPSQVSASDVDDVTSRMAASTISTAVTSTAGKNKYFVSNSVFEKY